MKEALAHALSGIASLAEDAWRERPVDRLHALASSQISNGVRTEREAILAALGKSWMALRDARCTKEMPEVLDGLIACLMWSRPKPTAKAADKVARWIIIERVHENCPTCRGRKEIPDTDKMGGREIAEGSGAIPMRECPECKGTGKHIYSNRERIEGMGIGAGELHKYQKLLFDAEMWLAQAESQCIRSTKRLLERW